MGLFKNNPGTDGIYGILPPRASGLTCEVDGQYDEGCHAFFIDEWNAAQTDPSKKVPTYAEYKKSPKYLNQLLPGGVIGTFPDNVPTPAGNRQPPIAGKGPVTVTGPYSYPGAAKTKTAGAGLAMAAAAALIFFIR